MKIVSCDILVVGSGGAAIRAAIAAKEANPSCKVAIATKGVLGKSGVTANSCSDRMAFHATLDHTEPGGPDAWTYHADDIYRIGGRVSDKTLADILAYSAKDAFHYLDGIGVPFAKKNGLADQFVTDGSDYARACYTGPRTAVHIEEALTKKFHSMDMELYNYTAVHRLVLEESRVIGALAINVREKDQSEAVFAFATGAVILATGGGGLIYHHNVFPGGMTGDGFTLAYQAGAELVNMEFIQIGIASTRTKFNCSGSMMRAIPRLINEAGEEILAKYFDKHTSLAEIYNILFKKGASWPVSYEHKTHVIDIALYKEWQAGHKVYLDYSQNPTGFIFDMLTPDNQARYEREMRCDLGREQREASPLVRLQEINPDTVKWFQERNIDLTRGDRIEVAACAQHFQGGVKIDEQARTTIAGLWAAGETAGGQHGANRPGGNALLDCQVFGKIAGEDAAAVCLAAPKASAGQLEQAKAAFLAVIPARGAITAKELRRRIRDIMEGGASIIRTEQGLSKAINELAELRKLTVELDEEGLNYYFETLGMLDVAELVLIPALMRDESRGPHLRFERYEDNVPIGRKDPEWQKYIVLVKKEHGLVAEIRETK